MFMQVANVAPFRLDNILLGMMACTLKVCVSLLYGVKED